MTGTARGHLRPAQTYPANDCHDADQTPLALTVDG